MEESSTYQATVRKGRLAEARRFLLLVGEEHFGPPSEAALAAVNAFENADQVEQVGRRLPHVASWEELLASPSRRKRNSRRRTDA